MLKPRIVYMVGWFYPDSVGGSERYVFMLAKEIQARGWDVTVAAPKDGGQESSYIYEGIPVYRYPVSLSPGIEEIRMHRAPEYFEVFCRWLKENKPDIVHIHSRTRGCGYFHMEYIKQKLGIPLILTIHSADFMCVGGTSLLWGAYPCDGRLSVYRCCSCWLKRRKIPWPIAVLVARVPVFIARAMERLPLRWATTLATVELYMDRQRRDRYIFKISDKVIVVAKWLKRVLLLNSIPEDKIFLSLHGLPEARVEKKSSGFFDGSGTLRIGFIGRFTYIKGAHILVKAIKKLPPDTNIELFLYGRTNSSEDQGYLDWLYKLSNAQARVKFMGELKEQGYLQAMMNLDILAVPSLWLETGPLVILEAFSMGVPVMGSDIGGIADLVRDGSNGLLVHIGDVRAWVTALKKIHRDPGLIKKLSNGIGPVRSNRDVAEEMNGIYRQFVPV